MRLRELNRLIAAERGCFWLPCPLCGQEFGGHEWRDQTAADGTRLLSSIPAPDGPMGMFVGICPDCTAAGLGRRDPVFDAHCIRVLEEYRLAHPEELFVDDGEPA